MITSVALNRITDFLPALDIGKLWSSLRVKKPSRPATAQERANRFHHVTADGSYPRNPGHLMGYVYVTPVNKVVYWYGCEEDAGAKKARYVPKTVEQLLNGRECAIFDDVRENAGDISEEDRKNLLCDYYGDQKGMVFLANTLG